VSRPPGIAQFLEDVSGRMPLSEWFERQIVKAYRFSKEGHRGQLRDGGERYFNHPKEVALRYLHICATHDYAPEANGVIAALLHDLVEDVDDIYIDDIEATFNRTVAAYVDSLTNKPGETDEQFIGRLQNAANTALLIKIADRDHNLDTLDECEPEKRRKKIEETERLVIPIVDAFDDRLANLLKERMAAVTI